MRLSGKNVWITGASRGIGLALARECIARGARVVLCNRDISDQKKEELYTLLGHRDHVSFRKLDLSKKEEIQRFCDDVDSDELPIDVLINNAGQLTGGLIEDQPLEDIYQMFQVNLVGLTHLIHQLLPRLLKRPEALIVNNASVSGVLFLPCASTYAAAKAGVVSLTRCLESELKGSNVRTLLLLTPGIKTRMFDEIPKLYGKHLDLSALSSRSPESYAIDVVNAMERKKWELWPRGSVRIALNLSLFCMGFFRRLSTYSFRRETGR